MTRSITPAPADAGVHLEQVILSLRVARHHAGLAQCPATLRKIRSALKSAEGAKRHLAQRPAAVAQARSTTRDQP